LKQGDREKLESFQLSPLWGLNNGSGASEQGDSNRSFDSTQKAEETLAFLLPDSVLSFTESFAIDSTSTSTTG
jgi:hypothetical protein